MKPKYKLVPKKIILVLLAVAFTALGCSGGNSGTNKQIVLKFWKPFDDSESTRPLIEAYQQKHPNVRVEYTKKNIQNYESDLLNALAAGTGPDVFSINNSWLPQYADKISPAPDKTFTFTDYKNTFVDAAVQDFTVDQKIYGTPLSVDSLALYYNKDLLGSSGIATPPKTWNELAKDVQKITRQDRTGYFTRSGIAMGTNSNVNRAVDIVYLLMLQAGSQPWSKDRLNPTFAQSVQKNGQSINPAVSALEFYTSFASPANPNFTWDARSDYSIDAFTNGRAAFLISYAYTYGTILQKAPNLNFDTSPVPQPNLSDPAVNFANYFGEVVSKQSQNQAWAWDFLKFITSKESLDKYYAANKAPASRKDLIELQISDPQIGVFANANLTAKTFYKPDQAKMDDIIGQMIDNVVLRGMRVSEAVNQGQTQAAAIVRRAFQPGR